MDETINELLNLDESAVDEQITILRDRYQLSEATVTLFVYALQDTVNTDDSLTATATYLGTCQELLHQMDNLSVLYEATVPELLNITPALTATLVRSAALLNQLYMLDRPSAGVGSSVSETLAVMDVLTRIQEGAVLDEAQISELLQEQVAFYQALLDTVLMSSDLAGMGVFLLQLDDTIQLDGEFLTVTSFFGALEESLHVSVSLSLDGLPYVGMALNTTNKSVTEFRPYAFNSLGTLRGKVYGARSDGLYLLEGADDAGTDIDAYVRTALTRIAGGRNAHVDSAYLGYSADGQMQIKVITTEATGSKTSRVYQLNAQNADTNRAGRIKIGKGVQSVYWAFELSNVLGSDFTIDVIELRVLALSRRV
jgi:hypothetical protein